MRLLKRKRVLLILDNCEHLATDVAHVVNAILGGCAQVRVLATARQPLALAAEREYRVPSLESDSAVALFVARAQAVDPAFAPNDAERAVVADICRRLDGIPLAIELAAARVKVLDVRTISARLGERFRLLTGGDATVPRQRTMRALIDWSFDLLPQTERALFRRLAIFSGGWTLEAAECVCEGPPLEAAAMLETLSAAYFMPQARVREGQFFGTRPAVHALMDISDGLSTDAARMARASDVDLVLDAAALAPSGPVAAAADALGCSPRSSRGRSGMSPRHSHNASAVHSCRSDASNPAQGACGLSASENAKRSSPQATTTCEGSNRDVAVECIRPS